MYSIIVTYRIPPVWGLHVFHVSDWVLFGYSAFFLCLKTCKLDKWPNLKCHWVWVVLCAQFLVSTWRAQGPREPDYRVIWWKYVDGLFVSKIQISINLAWRAASSTQSSLVAPKNPSACDYPHPLTVTVTSSGHWEPLAYTLHPWHTQFIPHFARSHDSHKDFHVRLVLVSP